VNHNHRVLLPGLSGPFVSYAAPKVDDLLTADKRAASSTQLASANKVLCEHLAHSLKATADVPVNTESRIMMPGLKLTHTCIISANVRRLADFYRHVLQIEPHFYGDDYVEFPTAAGTLAIFSAQAQETDIPGSAEPGKNRSIVLEFNVEDVDREYAKLQKTAAVLVKAPTTRPWGNRSIYFRDPDGNLVDFYVRMGK
jgi:catechol 2,3-dioxygenase-like lactoylglutathione lyase family enzyme